MWSPDEKEGLAVILPCAGSGSRLGLSEPKELFEVFEELPLIELSLQHIRVGLQDGVSVTRVIVVLCEGKEAVFKYIRRSLPDSISIKAVYADTRYDEWPGSIYSAHSEYAEKNLVLLPDSYLSLSEKDRFRSEQGDSLLRIVSTLIPANGLLVGARDCNDYNQLRRMGALSWNEKGQIIQFQDKPEVCDSYDSFWGCLAFKKAIGRDLYHFLSDSVKHQGAGFSNYDFCPAVGFRLQEYVDLGTWDAIKNFRDRYSNTL